jgi:hypothetical protein
VSKVSSKYYLLPLLLLCGFYIYQAIGFPAHDFANYYFGGKFLAEGRFADWIYFPYEFNHSIDFEGCKNTFASYAPNTPFLAVIFLPLSFFSIVTAKLIFNCASVLLLLYTLQRLVRHYKIDPVYLLLIPILFFIPIKNSLLFGQIYFLLFFLLGETWLAYKKNKLVKMAVMLSFAICIKIFPVLLVLVFVFRKKFRVVAYIAGCCAILVLVSVFLSSVEVWVFFLQNVLPKASDGEISEAYVTNYQSVLMFLKHMLVYDKIENPHPLFHYPVLFSALVVVFKIKLIVIGYYISRKVNIPLVALSYWILSMILLSPYGSTYTFVLLLIPFLALVKNDLAPWKKITGLALIFVTCNIPLAWFSEMAFPFSYLRLMALLLLFTLVFLLVYQKVRFKNVAVIALVPLLLVLFLMKETPVTSDAILGKDAPILIYDYTISNNTLTYCYWDEKGENSASMSYPIQQSTSVVLHENQIFHNGNQLTFDKSNKRKPLLIDGKTLIYLSDAGRGIGFYTLRQVALNPH